MVNFLKEYVDGKKGVVSAEVKVSVVSFKKTPPGLCPYFVVYGLPQIRELSDISGLFHDT